MHNKSNESHASAAVELDESQGKLISLTQESIDTIFNTATHQTDYIIALYRVAFPDWDNIASVDGHPQISKHTATHIFERAIAFDKINHADVMAGGAWLNKGFSTLESLPDWRILPCDFTLQEIL